eukprot:m.15556 g.15556  ORF g.15556 m.15556 type:complete len:172 (-) comp4931_c0_seq1:436-951(-)
MKEMTTEIECASDAIQPREAGEATGASAATVASEIVAPEIVCDEESDANDDDEDDGHQLEEVIANMITSPECFTKCHPELNPIEQFWAAVKVYLRRVCGYTFPELKVNVPLSLLQVRVEQVQRYFRRTERFEALYLFEAQKQMPLPTAVRDYAMKKYKRHRVVPDPLLQDV